MRKSQGTATPETRDGTTTKTAPETVEQIAGYFKWLFSAKKCSNKESMLRYLREGRRVSEKSSQKLDEPLEEDEIRKAIRRMALGKSPGPDGLGAEFYKEFEDLVADDLTAMLLESHARGRLPKGVRTGEIISIHKKDDTREIRNYRPITLLNVDYKILGKTLVARLKHIMDEIISPQQLGFVPGRVITEATHLLDLLIGALEEADEEGILVAAKWEKAFDRVGWDYLHSAVEALGFGEGFQQWKSW